MSNRVGPLRGCVFLQGRGYTARNRKAPGRQCGCCIAYMRRYLLADRRRTRCGRWLVPGPLQRGYTRSA